MKYLLCNKPKVIPVAYDIKCCRSNGVTAPHIFIFALDGCEYSLSCSYSTYGIRLLGWLIPKARMSMVVKRNISALTVNRISIVRAVTCYFTD
jgi:hypothetical protein